MATTPIYGWVIPTEYNTNYFSQFVSMMDSVDTTVDSIDQRVGDALSIDGFDIGTITAGDTDKALIADTTQNDIVQSENLNASPWTGTRVVTGAADEIIATSLDNSHLYTQSRTYVGGTNTARVKAKPGDVNHILIQCVATSNNFAYFDLTTGAIGTNSNIVAYSVVMDGDWCVIKIEFTASAVVGAYTIMPAIADNDNSFAGDNVTPSIYVTEMSVVPFPISDNVKYITTTTAAVASETTISIIDYKQNKWDAGLLEGPSGWGAPSNGDGIEWSSPTSVGYRRQYFGATPTATTLVAGASELGAYRMEWSDGTSNRVTEGEFSDGTDSMALLHNISTGNITTSYTTWTLNSLWVEYRN